MEKEPNKGPVQTLRTGAIFVKLWEQKSESGPYVTASIGRTYRDKQTGEYGESNSLNGGDVLKAHALLLKAHDEIGKWRAYYKEQSAERAQDAALPGMEPEQDQGLLAQRDAALSQAKQSTPRQGHSQNRGREPEA